MLQDWYVISPNSSKSQKGLVLQWHPAGSSFPSAQLLLQLSTAGSEKTEDLFSVPWMLQLKCCCHPLASVLDSRYQNVSYHLDQGSDKVTFSVHWSIHCLLLSFEGIKWTNIFLKSRNCTGHFSEPLGILCHGKNFGCQQHLCAVILLVVPLKPNAQFWFQKELCGITREMPMSSGIIFINSWDATGYQWVTFVGLVYLLRGKDMVENSALPTLLLWWTEMDVTTICYPDSRGTDISIDPVRTNHAAYTACVRLSIYVLHCAPFAFKTKSDLSWWNQLINHTVFLAFYLLFVTTNLGKRQASIIVLW